MTAEILKLSPSETAEFILNAILCKQVPYIAGPPGIGKSQVVHGVLAQCNLKMIDLRLSQILSEDMTGLPERNAETGKAEYLPFSTFPLQGDKIPDGYDGWGLLLDELPSASEEVLAASYSLILDRTVGGRKLHDRCVVIAAGNRASDSAIARELPDTLITRMLPCEMKVNVADWVHWASGHKKSNEQVVSFIEKNPTMLYAPTPVADREENETYPTPRGWEKVFAHVNLHEKRTKKEVEGVDSAGLPTGRTEISISPISEPMFALMAAAVGPLAARSFREEYDEAISLPNPWEVAQSPNSTRIPGTNAGKAKLTSELSRYWLESNGQTRENVTAYMNRMGGEYAALFVNQIQSKVGSTASDKAMVEKLQKRLNVDPLLGGTLPDSDPDNIPF
ncbi:ATPase [Roseobacter phage RD-1410W1-01]|uniref:ATPase n=1 Tax=Roseobacter phage RD-1410W1-01 TaxID=1815984 RepID=A0A191VYH6_9CAUD|nr:ATPase [Roseobacter phage RD-1410W1-01]ANJ20761.1 ATPase [Roseobacter phage RD-1410W1-01]